MSNERKKCQKQTKLRSTTDWLVHINGCSNILWTASSPSQFKYVAQWFELATINHVTVSIHSRNTEYYFVNYLNAIRPPALSWFRGL